MLLINQTKAGLAINVNSKSASHYTYWPANLLAIQTITTVVI